MYGISWGTAEKGLLKSRCRQVEPQAQGHLTLIKRSRERRASHRHAQLSSPSHKDERRQGRSALRRSLGVAFYYYIPLYYPCLLSFPGWPWRREVQFRHSNSLFSIAKRCSFSSSWGLKA